MNDIAVRICKIRAIANPELIDHIVKPVNKVIGAETWNPLEIFEGDDGNQG